MIPVKPRMRAPAKGHQPRVLFFNDGQQHLAFQGNYVSTTKYTVFTYFPKALFEQFRYAPTLCARLHMHAPSSAASQTGTCITHKINVSHSVMYNVGVLQMFTSHLWQRSHAHPSVLSGEASSMLRSCLTSTTCGMHHMCLASTGCWHIRHACMPTDAIRSCCVLLHICSHEGVP